ncbi:MAG: type IV pilus secretin PilQ [Acidobacteria bacterium]|nr:type IV pilus secretin PilQ [Acidobacteriota bacterium]
MNPQRLNQNLPCRRPVGRRLLTLAVALLAAPSLAMAWQGQEAFAPETTPLSQEERIPAGQLPSEADVLQSSELDGSTITINFVGTDIRDVSRFFSQVTGLNVVVDPDLSGPVTVRLFEIPWDIAFESILRSHRYGYEVDRNIVRVASLSTLAAEAEDRAILALNQELATPLETTAIRLSYADAIALSPVVEPQLSQRGEVIVDERTNSLIIKDTPGALNEINTLIEALDIAAPQVLIESRIVETTKNFSRSLGVQWGFGAVADAAHGNSTGLVFPNDFSVVGNNNAQGGTQAAGIGGVPFAVNLPANNPTSGVALTMGSILDTFRLDVALSAMEEEGRGKIISSPKVTAQDNVPASIESGRRIPVQTLIDNTASITFINANLQLDVTPQITAEGTVMLDIVVDKSEPDFGNAVLGIPTIFTRRAETKLLVRDGGTTVIGGIFQMSATEEEQRVPFLHRVPLVGNLFKSKDTEQSNNELLIFITPRILEQ